jgi:putative iron-regulated protein
MKFIPPILILLTGLFCLPCVAVADLDKPAAENLKVAFINHYADLLEAEYADSLELARRFQTNVEALLKAPTAEHLADAKQSWIASRQPYSQTEIARFYDGPIEPVENFVNGWPIDPSYLDYTAGSPNAGIINNVTDYPEITRDVIVSANENPAEQEDHSEAEKNVSTGFHAIEFLLWGQDLYGDSPGRRPCTDYLDAPGGPGRHAARRRQYLNFLAQTLVDDLQAVAIQWSPSQPNNYRARFLALPGDVALTKIFAGVGNLSSAELMHERLLVPYTTKSQENEQDCFSDTTHLDLLRNETGVQNIFTGRYTRADGTSLDGPGLLDLIEKSDPKLAANLRAQLAASVAALKAIPPPFDQAILGDDSAPGRSAIKQALAALQVQNQSIVTAAAILRIELNLK